MSEYKLDALGVPAGADAIALASAGLEHRLALCAGAGLSRAEPTELPDGATLAGLIHSRASRVFGDVVVDVPADNLLAVADAVSAQPGGLAALQSIAAGVASFTESTPNPGHKLVAALIAEGAATVLLTNWDDCVERSSLNTGRVLAVVTDEDRRNVVGALLFKVHGCATRPATLLLSSAQLADPPRWASTEFATRAGSSFMVFIGLADIASYAKQRVEQLIADVGDVNHLFVVAPSIKADWSESAWASLTPSLPEVNKKAETADSFLDRLTRAWVQLAFMELEAAGDASANAPLRAYVAGLVGALGKVDALTYVEWIRATVVGAVSGTSVVHAGSAQQVLLALAVHSKGSIAPVSPARPVVTASGEKLELLIADAKWPLAVRREAQRRSRAARDNGDYVTGESVHFLCAGHYGALPQVVPFEDITSPDAAPDDIIDGSSTGTISLLDANAVIGAAA